MKGEGKGFLINFQPNSCWRATPKINYHSAVMCVSILSLMGQYAKEELHLVFPPMIWARSCVQSPINITQDERNFDFSFLVFGEVFDFDCACTCYGCKGNRKSSKEITFSVQTFVKRERLRPAFTSSVPSPRRRFAWRRRSPETLRASAWEVNLWVTTKNWQRGPLLRVSFSRRDMITFMTGKACLLRGHTWNKYMSIVILRARDWLKAKPCARYILWRSKVLIFS